MDSSNPRGSNRQVLGQEAVREQVPQNLDKSLLILVSDPAANNLRDSNPQASAREAGPQNQDRNPLIRGHDLVDNSLRGRDPRNPVLDLVNNLPGLAVSLPPVQDLRVPLPLPGDNPASD